ncbi:LamG domain-containing protein [Candidatus Poribacteria bacterium]|nr:LamG domain-containing protein [Candidatus Poribacteria bacterium]
MNEGKGDTVEDISGNKNHGTIMGKAKWGKGKFGQCVELDGISYISVPSSESLGMTEQVTLTAWIKTDKNMVDMWADRQVIVGKHYLEYEIGIYPQGQIHTYTNDGTGANYDEGIMVSMAGKLPDKDADWEKGKWYHLAWTLNKQREVAYVNGIKLGEATKAHPGTKPLANPLEIGRRVGGSLYLTGAVDEVGIFKVELKEEDIQAIVKGYESALGLTAVMPSGKLTSNWAAIKSQR